MAEPARLRAPQQDRSRATRARILDGALGAMVEHGYAGASTQVVARAARVSQGSVFQHFPSKALLVGAAVERILADMVEDFERGVAASVTDPAGADLETRARAGVRELWRIYERPDMPVLFEIYLAARTDTALAEVLAPVLERHQGAIAAEAVRLLPELEARADVAPLVMSVVLAMQGFALGLFAPRSLGTLEPAALFESMTTTLLALIDGRG